MKTLDIDPSTQHKQPLYFISGLYFAPHVPTNGCLNLSMLVHQCDGLAKSGIRLSSFCMTLSRGRLTLINQTVRQHGCMWWRQAHGMGFNLCGRTALDGTVKWEPSRQTMLPARSQQSSGNKQGRRFSCDRMISTIHWQLMCRVAALEKSKTVL